MSSSGPTMSVERKMNSPGAAPADSTGTLERFGGVLGTPLLLTNYESLTSRITDLARENRPVAVDFTNTQVVTLRRHDPSFRAVTSRFDYFVPDGMPLIWCLNAQRAGLRDRVYGPTFMRNCLRNSSPSLKHYFLGGSVDCLMRLKAAFLEQNPNLRIVGAQHGYFKPEQDQAIVEEIHRLSPDFIWVGLGTPKQQTWIHQHKERIPRGVLLAVGFAFDVNAGTKPDAPPWMQRYGLTWIFRLFSEPRRLGPRYLRWNCLFLFYLIWDGIRGRAWTRF